MQFRKTEEGYLLRLLKNEKLLETLTKFCTEQTIHAATFSGVGAVVDAELGFYHLEQKQYHFQKIEQPMEIVSLLGNVSLVDNNPFLHSHIMLGKEDLTCMGGHLKEATVGATCEIFLSPLQEKIERVYDAEIGLKLLQCTDR